MQFSGTLRKVVLSALVIGAAFALTGCVVNGGGYADDGYRDDGYRGYPPASPRHGYRYAYPGGLSLIFDSGLGLYSVYGYPDYYYSGGYFYRWDQGYWNRSRNWDRRWERCDSRYWPRPIRHVHNNYYGRGQRPHHDWDRDGDRHRGDRHDRGDKHERHDRDDRRDHGGRGDDHGRGDDRERGDRDGRPGYGGRPTPGGGHGPGDHDDRGDRPQRDPGDANGDGRRERGERHIGRGEPQHRDDDRQREIREDLREQARERDPVDHLRHPDADARRGSDFQRVQREAVERAQAERRGAERTQVERRAVERAPQEQRVNERRERHDARRAESSQQREAEPSREPERREEQRSNDDGGDQSSEPSSGQRGGARGDNWEDVRGDRR